MSSAYDAKVLEKNSSNLYWSADITTLLFPAIGLVIGGSLGYSLFKYSLVKTIGAVGGGALGGYAGFRYARVKATEMRSQAQTALCLAQIEQNTRHMNKKTV